MGLKFKSKQFSFMCNIADKAIQFHFKKSYDEDDNEKPFG